MPTVSISRKFFFALAGATLVFAAGMAVLMHTFLRHRLTDLLEEKGVAVGRQVAEACVNPVITGKFFRVELMLRDLRRNEGDLVYGYVLDADGAAVADTFPGAIPAALTGANPAALSRDVTTKELSTSRGPVLDVGFPLLDGKAGVLHLGFSRAGVNRDVNRIVLLILALAVVSLGLAEAAIVVFTRAVTRPLVELSSAVENFGHGEEVGWLKVRSEDEVGVLTKGFNEMVANRRQIEQERERLIDELQGAMSEIKTLRGLLPICSSCKRIKSDQGSWEQVEAYLSSHADVEFTHGICPECMEKLYPEYARRRREAKK
ncbi:MAG: HAMP domain-containing protein [Deltaproteobacteria bacterium]|nr:HAMP domain-containing protein [Deltaproteobacteria bacterium]